MVSWCTHAPSSPSPSNLSPLICKLQNSPFLIPPVQNGVCTSLPVPASGFSSVTKISASVKCASCVKNRLNEVSQGRRRVSQLMSRFVISHPYASLSCLPPVHWRLSWWSSSSECIQPLQQCYYCYAMLTVPMLWNNILSFESSGLLRNNKFFKKKK